MLALALQVAQQARTAAGQETGNIPLRGPRAFSGRAAMSAVIIKALWIYGLAIIVSLAVAVVIKVIVVA